MTSSKRFHLLLFVIAILFAFLTTLVFMKQVESWKKSSSQTHTVGVVVVTKALPEHSIVDVSDVDVEQIPESAVEAGSVTQVDEVAGKFTASTWYPGQQVLSQMVVASSDQASFPMKVPKGLRAFTIPDDVVVGVDHLISPGDKVDVLATFTSKNGGGIAETILQNTLVLDVDNPPPTDSQSSAGSQASSTVNAATGGAKTDTLTVAVTPTQAEALVLGENFGQLHVTLRHPGDSTITTMPALASPAH